MRMLPFLLVFLAGCESTKIVGLGEDCTVDWGFEKRECAPGLVCDDREGCKREEHRSGAPALLPAPTTTTDDAGADEATDDAETDAGAEGDACTCAPGEVETTTAGCPAGVVRHRECTESCTWGHFSTTCS